MSACTAHTLHFPKAPFSKKRGGELCMHIYSGTGAPHAQRVLHDLNLARLAKKASFLYIYVMRRRRDKERRPKLARTLPQPSKTVLLGAEWTRRAKSSPLYLQVFPLPHTTACNRDEKKITRFYIVRVSWSHKKSTGPKAAV